MKDESVINIFLFQLSRSLDEIIIQVLVTLLFKFNLATTSKDIQVTK